MLTSHYLCTTLYIEPIVTYYSCKTLTLGILLGIKAGGRDTETVISILFICFLVNVIHCLVLLV